MRLSRAFFALGLALLTSAGLTAQPAGATIGNLTTYSHLPGRFLGIPSLGAERYFAVNLKPGATVRDAHIVAQYFRRFGLRVEVSPDSAVLLIDGTYAQAGAAAHVGFARVELHGERFTTITGAESYPPEVASRVIATTMNEGPHVRSLYALPPAYLQVAPNAGYTPANIATYYNLTPITAAGYKGAYRAVAIAACLAIKAADIAKFESTFGIPQNQPTVRWVPSNITTTINDIEPTLDVERVVGTAPSVRMYLYLVSNCTVGNFATMLAQIYTDYTKNLMPNLDSLTISYGLTEHDYDLFGLGSLLTAQDQTFTNLQGKGITTFAASGDNGSYGDAVDGDITVLYPASDKNVLAIGGTSANSMSPATTTRLSENGWGGSGGGVSDGSKCTSSVKVGCMPAWQVGVPGMIGTTSKNLPDFSLAADPNTGYQMYVTDPSIPGCPATAPCLLTVGGTSTSSPTWAAFVALVNNWRVAHSKPRLSNVQASMYAQRVYAGIYFDIVNGSGGYYSASTGYDRLTGLGSPNFYNLFAKLVFLP